MEKENKPEWVSSKIKDRVWSSEPQVVYLGNMSEGLSNLEQFEYVRSYDWGDEKIQIDIFQEALKRIESENPSMMEVGSAGIYGSFYSLLFEKWFDKKCSIINSDPTLEYLNAIKEDWKGIHLTNAVFYHGYVGIPRFYQARQDFFPEETPKLSILKMLEENGIEQLDILHADIQGSETSMLEEIFSENIQDKIRYYFISTHSDNNFSTHYECLKIFNDKKFKIHFEDYARGGWGDGLIVAEKNQI